MVNAQFTLVKHSAEEIYTVALAYHFSSQRKMHHSLNLLRQFTHLFINLIASLYLIYLIFL